jgi:vacuolar-type H+-ATPase subunit F/Vma7
MVKENIPYTYDREAIPVKVEKLSVILFNIVERLNQIDLQLIAVNDDLSFRIAQDIKYITSVLPTLEDEDITSFNSERKLDNIELSQEATDALTLFLFEESYKEYELIMIYNYLKAHSNDAYINRIFQILVDESFFHLKSFGDMMAKMGILGVPRSIYKEMYQVEDIVEFFLAGIDEELAAKEECRKLSEAVGANSPELAKFFDFINNQENYHIALMKDALAHWESKENE